MRCIYQFVKIEFLQTNLKRKCVSQTSCTSSKCQVAIKMLKNVKEKTHNDFRKFRKYASRHVLRLHRILMEK